ncbi:MAG: hypothetical protein ACOY4K_09590 [Pseudomonadota bacterium]
MDLGAGLFTLGVADLDGHLREVAHNPFCEITAGDETRFAAPGS